jgi:hypothetical protein
VIGHQSLLIAHQSLLIAHQPLLIAHFSSEISTGFLPASNNHSSSPLNDTSIVSLLNNGTTQALLRLTPVVNAKTYQVQTSADGGKTWQESCISSQARRIVIFNLVPGTTYAVRARAIGGSTGASAWTGASSIMST